MKTQVTVLYCGRVQGVGFRAAVRQLACGYNVNGAVRNLPDGRVELIGQGEKAELMAFLQGIAESGLSDFIKEHQERWEAATNSFRGFAIIP